MILQPWGISKVTLLLLGSCGPEERRNAVSNLDASIQLHGKTTKQFTLNPCQHESGFHYNALVAYRRRGNSRLIWV